MTADRVVALALGLLVITIGVNGLRVGKVLIRGTPFLREREPLAFWIVVCLWIALGLFIITIVLLRVVSV